MSFKSKKVEKDIVVDNDLDVAAKDLNIVMKDIDLAADLDVEDTDFEGVNVIEDVVENNLDISEKEFWGGVGPEDVEERIWWWINNRCYGVI